MQTTKICITAGKICRVRIAYRNTLGLLCPKQNKAMNTSNNTRQLTILRKYSFRHKSRKYIYHPDLRLCGKWLSEAGFASGQSVVVRCFKRKLVIVPVANKL